MKKLKHSKYKNTGILFEMLVRKLTSETLSSNKTTTVDIIKKYFGKNTELAKELYLYNALLKEQYKSEAQALDYIRTIKSTHSKLNQSLLKRQRYNLVKEISDRFNFDDISKIHINNYKTLASIYMIFEYQETDNPKQLLECKNVILENGMLVERKQPTKDLTLETFETQPKDVRLLTYKLMIDKFNEKYSKNLDESQKQLLNKYITNVNDTTALKEYIQTIIPKIKKDLASQAKLIVDPATQIKVSKLSEMLCTVENMKTIKESHVLSLLRYFDLVRELKEMHQ
jgi:molybdopterin converting factor small subunit